MKKSPSHFLLVAVLFLAGCAYKPDAVEHTQPYSATGSHTIYLVNHGWHTGIVVPQQPFSQSVPQLVTRFNQADYLEFGWGDKGFYQADKITFGLAIKALLWPTDSVVHVVGLTEAVDVYFPSSQIESLLLTDVELQSLVKFIAGSFAFDQAGLIQPTQLGIYGDSQFYQAIGNYHAFNTCNNWTAKALKSFGMDIFVSSKLTADSVMDYVKAYKLEREQNANHH
ncbi:TIGR02117 family protein [Catenovulum agarivorans]|uniref:TIGR02117 family protein n=1 Tax=Catenovulum agarivorans TaxID=1172192 RepID=UPI0002E6F22E|nr:TIGR02117 family protein [Catenovulum agarivorans]